MGITNDAEQSRPGMYNVLKAEASESPEVQLEDAKDLGRKNLAEHGIELGAYATTADIMNGIAKIPPFKYVTTLANFFTAAIFSGNAELIIDAPKVFDLNNAFKQSNIRKVKISGNKSGSPVQLLMAFNVCTSLEEIDFSGFCLNVEGAISAFTRCGRLKRILGEFDFSAIRSTGSLASPFLNTTSLEEVRIKKETLYTSIQFTQSSKLSAESVQSIIDGLATVEEQQTVKFHSVIVEKLTDEQLKTAANKNWSVG